MQSAKAPEPPKMFTPLGDELRVDPSGFVYAGGDGYAVRDWTNPKSEIERFGRWNRVASQWEKYWEENWRENKPFIKASVPPGEPFQKGPHHGETCYIVGNGPGLRWNGHLLAGKDNIIGCNRVAHLEGVVPRYYVAIDCGKPFGGMKPEWVDRIADKTTGVLSIVTFPPLARKFKNVWWFDHWGGDNKLSRLARRKSPVELAKLDTALMVTYTMLQLAYRLGYKKIVLVGFDYAFTGGYEHFSDNEPTMWLEGPNEVIKTKGRMKEVMDRRKIPVIQVKDPELIVGKDPLVLTTGDFVQAMKHLATQAWFLARRGVKIINCTERGVLKLPWIPCERLEDHV